MRNPLFGARWRPDFWPKYRTPTIRASLAPMHSACDDNEFRDGRGEDVIRRKRSDTRVDSIEATYRVDLHARGDMLLGTLLAERGFELQSQLITAYQGRLKYHARKRRLFLSFHAEERPRVDVFRRLASDPNVDVEFYDGSLQVPLNSERADYIKKTLRKRMSRASVAV